MVPSPLNGALPSPAAGRVDAARCRSVKSPTTFWICVRDGRPGAGEDCVAEPQPDQVADTAGVPLVTSVSDPLPRASGWAVERRWHRSARASQRACSFRTNEAHDAGDVDAPEFDVALHVQRRAVDRRQRRVAR